MFPALLLLLVSWQSDGAPETLKEIRPFLKQYCYECHGPEKQKQDIRFDNLQTDLSQPLTLERWQAVKDQLILGEMPPKKKPQPPFAERKKVIDRVTATLKLAYAQNRSTGGRAVIRRLNKFEMRNTLRDLFHLNHPDFHPMVVSGLYDFNGNGITAHKTIEPTRTFQDDQTEDGFDTIGNRLVMSDFLLNMILGAAEESIAMATHNERKPELGTRRYAAPILKNPQALGGHSLDRWHRDLNTGYDAVFQRFDRYGRVGPDDLRRGMGIAARYRITVELSGHNQKHPWGEMLKTNQDEPFLVGLYLERKEHLRGPRIERRAQWKVPGDGRKRTFSVETWIDKTWTPWVGWENGPHIRHNVHGNLVKQYHPDRWTKEPKGKLKEAWTKKMAMILFEDYKGPHLRVHRMTIEPLIGAWPPRSHTALYGDGPIGEADRKDLFHAFAERAYRRPVASEEIDPFVALAEKLEADGDSPQDAMKGAYAAILCSPEFLYIRQKSDVLDDYEIATRLSYFIWSSMPDDTLMALAKAGKLRENGVLDQQVARLLADPKAAAFSRHFVERWLHLYDLGKMAPDKKGPFSIYFRIQDDLVPQVDAYFTDLLETNGKISLLIDSDYTFMNAGLAELFYKREGIYGRHFRKVPLTDRRLGGIFTLPAVMTVTANGVDTNPVVRGVYVLENILGTPPNPPPADVEPLSPTLRDAKTLKEQLALHRKQEACVGCHRKIDPMGFPLESFDPIGRLREFYPKMDRKMKGPGIPVDTTTTLIDGTEIKGVVEFKAMLLKRKGQVIRCLTEKMLTYASGRRMEAGDRGEVDRITEALRKKGNGLRDLVHLVAQSRIVLNK